ncbi:MAG: hypothetical protein IT539_12495 [Bradyrhizobiaceae bacterium]|nr:hypothetical protein [Bradyrhizobiaceae bacterium]
MTKFTDEQRRAIEERQRQEEETRLGIIRKIVDQVGTWKECENRACRRVQGCADPRACQEKHWEGIRAVFQQEIFPALARRYPTVQWGAPAGATEGQLEAAIEAEREEEARRDGCHADARESARRRKKIRVQRQPLYDPGDV